MKMRRTTTYGSVVPHLTRTARGWTLGCPSMSSHVSQCVHRRFSGSSSGACYDRTTTTTTAIARLINHVCAHTPCGKRTNRIATAAECIRLGSVSGAAGCSKNGQAGDISGSVVTEYCKKHRQGKTTPENTETSLKTN